MALGTTYDSAYFEARLERNRILAAQSTDPIIRDLHLEYVRLYEFLLLGEEEALTVPA